MKNIRIYISTIFVLLFTILTSILVSDKFSTSKKSIVSDSVFLFKQAILQDHNQRLSYLDFSYYSHQIDNNWPKEKIVFTTEKGERVQDNIDSIRALPEEEKLKIIRETLLVGKHPINPDTLNSCFQQTLQNRGLFLSTGIRYTEVENNKTQYSGTDTTFFASAYPLNEYKTGIFNEIAVQAYVKVPFTTVVGKAGIGLLIPLFAWLALVCLYIMYLYKAIKKKRAEAKLTDADRIREMLRFNMEKTGIQYRNQEIKLPPTLAQLVSLFLNKTDFFLTKEEIVNELWGDLEDSSNRISQTINRLRNTLSIIPELEIESIRGTGYRIAIRK